ncbi:MAG: glycosyltransferase family 2 protein [Sediminibacterium sp.]
MKKKLISIVTPVRNEEGALLQFYDTLTAEVSKYSESYEFEFVFTDNASEDSTFLILRKLASTDKRIRAYRLSKNFGYQKSIFTGYSLSKGNCAVQLDCDLQDPPEMIRIFLEKWEEGFDIVYGVRKKRAEGPIITFLRKLFYRFLNMISDEPLPNDAGDFMLIDRKIIDIISGIKDSSIYIRGSVFSLGFKKHGIEYARRPRTNGKSKFPLVKLFHLASDAVFTQSSFLVRLMIFSSVFIGFFAFITSLVYIVLKVKGIYFPTGYVSLFIALLISIAINTLFIGILGQYMLRIYNIVRALPVSLIEESVNDDLSKS